MKHIVSFLVVLLLFSCSGSDTYRGDWKAMNKVGEQYNLHFEGKSFTVTNSAGETTNFGYTQNKVHIENGVETYGLNLEDGRKCQLTFPLAEDESVGVLLDANGNVLYTISRSSFVSYEDIYSLE